MSEGSAIYTRAVLLGLVTTAFTAALGLWARHLGVGPGTVPVFEPQGRSYWLAGLALALLTGVVAQVLDRGSSSALSTAEARQARDAPTPELATGGILPAVSTLAAVMLLGVYHRPGAMTGVLLGSFVVHTSGAIAHHHLFTADEVLRQRARGVYTILIHVVAFVALSMVYINKVRSLFSATTVLVLGVALLLQLTEGEAVRFGRRAVYAVAGGLMLGEVTWVLNYWRATGWTGGATLLIVFYLAAGLIAAQVRRGVEVRDVAEYAGIGALAFAIVVYSMLR